MSQRGWEAKHLLQPFWSRYPGGRDALAQAVGTTGTVLSSINTGKRPLGASLAGRLASELRVSLLELGAPSTEAADDRSQDLLRRLEAIAVGMRDLADAQEEILRRLPPGDALAPRRARPKPK